MESDERSSLTFKSNLQPVQDFPMNGKELPWDDEVFLGKIEDPAALEEMEKSKTSSSFKRLPYSLSPNQREIYRRVSGHCAYAYPDDYPWGTVKRADGRIGPACRCTREDCKYFHECRVNFNARELEASKENNLSKVQEFEEIYRQAAASSKTSSSEKKRLPVEILGPEISEPEPVERTPADGSLKPDKLSGKNINQKPEVKPLPADKPPVGSSGPVTVAALRSEPLPSPKIDDKSGDKSSEKSSGGKIATINPIRSGGKGRGHQVLRRPHPVINVSNGNPAPAAPQHKIPTFASFKDVSQEYIEQLPVEKRLVVNAGPGTGKTYTLIEKIKYMTDQETVDPETVLVLCFSRAAVEVVRKRLAQAADAISASAGFAPAWWQVEVRTFDSFVTALLSQIIEYMPELLPSGYTLEGQGYNDRIQTAKKVFIDHPKETRESIMGNYRHLIVDEVQDLVSDRADMVFNLLKDLPDECGFTLLGDSCQAIYDYQVNKGDDNQSKTSSKDFYQNIFNAFPGAEYLSLTQNHRQTRKKLGDLTLSYRESILKGDEDDRVDEADKLIELIPVSDYDMSLFDQRDAEKYLKKGTLGILTRNNGQALRISAWLRKNNVEHRLQKPLGRAPLAEWIVDILMKALDEADVIDHEEFVEIFSERYPEKSADVERYWKALTAPLIRGGREDHFEIEKVLKGIYQNGIDPLLFINPDEPDYKITVSDVHRVKGREFDTVMIMNEIIPGSDVQKANAKYDGWDEYAEHKVSYVALTRPKEKLQTINIPEKYLSMFKYIYFSNDEIRRCSTASRSFKKRYLVNFEVGDIDDIDERSLAIGPKLQDWINQLHCGERLRLIKNSGEESPVQYNIVPESDEDFVIGHTSESFYWSLLKAIRKIKKLGTYSVYPKLFPNIFQDVYFDGRVTCISSDGHGLKGARKVGSMYLWKGISIRGFAEMVKDYY